MDKKYFAGKLPWISELFFFPLLCLPHKCALKFFKCMRKVKQISVAKVFFFENSSHKLTKLWSYLFPTICTCNKTANKTCLKHLHVTVSYDSLQSKTRHNNDKVTNVFFFLKLLIHTQCTQNIHYHSLHKGKPLYIFRL